MDVIGGYQADGDGGGVETGAADPAIGMMKRGDRCEEIVGELRAGCVTCGVAGGGE
jgi:hypothetical protein